MDPDLAFEEFKFGHPGSSQINSVQPGMWPCSIPSQLSKLGSLKSIAGLGHRGTVRRMSLFVCCTNLILFVSSATVCLCRWRLIEQRELTFCLLGTWPCGLLASRNES